MLALGSGFDGTDGTETPVASFCSFVESSSDGTFDSVAGGAAGKAAGDVAGAADGGIVLLWMGCGV